MLPPRILSKIEFTSTCWLWTGAIKKSNSYGVVWWDGNMRLAHRVVYELLVGPIAHELDHVRERGCVHRHCVNPAHLEDVTHAENLRRGNCHLNAWASLRRSRLVMDLEAVEG